MFNDDAVQAAVTPIASGPVVEAVSKPRHPFYVWHASGPHVFNGKPMSRGLVLRGEDALAFEIAREAGNVGHDWATPTPHDKDPEA